MKNILKKIAVVVIGFAVAGSAMAASLGSPTGISVLEVNIKQITR